MKKYLIYREGNSSFDKAGELLGSHATIIPTKNMDDLTVALKSVRPDDAIYCDKTCYWEINKSPAKTLINLYIPYHDDYITKEGWEEAIRRIITFLSNKYSNIALVDEHLFDHVPWTDISIETTSLNSITDHFTLIDHHVSSRMGKCRPACEPKEVSQKKSVTICPCHMTDTIGMLGMENVVFENFVTFIVNYITQN